MGNLVALSDWLPAYEYLRANNLIEIATHHIVEARNRTKHSFNLSVLETAGSISSP